MEYGHGLLYHLQQFAHDNPGTAALCCLGFGAVIGSIRTARVLSGLTLAAGLGYLAYNAAGTRVRSQSEECGQLDVVEEAGIESFPASDSPGW